MPIGVIKGASVLSPRHEVSKLDKQSLMPFGDLTRCVYGHREYRDARKIPLNVEHRMMLGMAPDYDHLMVIQKVEVFEHALDSTSGQL